MKYLLILLIGVLGVGIFYLNTVGLLTRKRTEARMPAAEKVTPSPSPTAVPDSMAAPSTVDANPAAKLAVDGASQGKSYPDPPKREKNDLKIRNALARCSGSKCTLRLKVRGDERCQLGDIDIIETDFQEAKAEPVVLVAVETLDPHSRAVLFSKRVSLDALRKGVDLSVTLPDFKMAQQIGIFVCRDIKNEAKCQDKEFTDVANIPLRIGHAKMSNPFYKAPDYLYFFQLVFRETNEKLVVFNDTVATDMSFEIFEERLAYIQERVPNAEKYVQKNIMERVELWSRAMFSVPLEPTDGGVEALLPMWGKSCKKGPSPEELLGKDWKKYIKNPSKEGLPSDAIPVPKRK